MTLKELSWHEECCSLEEDFVEHLISVVYEVIPYSAQDVALQLTEQDTLTFPDKTADLLLECGFLLHKDNTKEGRFLPMVLKFLRPRYKLLFG